MTTSVFCSMRIFILWAPPGVHTIANLAKKRLPLMVRLAHGSPPLAGGCGPAANKAAQHLFLPELRLLARSDEAGGCAHAPCSP